MNLGAGLTFDEGTIRLNDDLAHQLTPLGVKDITGPLQINIKANGNWMPSVQSRRGRRPISVPGGVGIEGSNSRLSKRQTVKHCSWPLHCGLGGTITAAGEAHLFEDTAWVDVEVDGIEPIGLPIEFGELVTDLIGGGVRGSVRLG